MPKRMTAERLRYIELAPDEAKPTTAEIKWMARTLLNRRKNQRDANVRYYAKHKDELAERRDMKAVERERENEKTR